MTLTFMRPALALALAMALAACGGKATFPVSGTIVGLNYNGLVLSTNGMDLPVAAGAPSFSFPNQLSYGEVYDVVAKTQPAHQTCSVMSFAGPNGIIYNGPTDTAGRFGAINIGVLCAMNSANLGGTITGLTSAGLQLTNGSSGGVATPAAGATTFVLPAVTYGVTYGVTVLAQPANDVCTVSANGTGVMGDAAVANVAVTCVPKPT
jgi:hypothetical protein